MRVPKTYDDLSKSLKISKDGCRGRVSEMLSIGYPIVKFRVDNKFYLKRSNVRTKLSEFEKSFTDSRRFKVDNKFAILNAISDESLWSPNLTKVSELTGIPVSTVFDFVKNYVEVTRIEVSLNDRELYKLTKKMKK